MTLRLVSLSLLVWVCLVLFLCPCLPLVRLLVVLILGSGWSSFSFQFFFSSFLVRGFVCDRISPMFLRSWIGLFCIVLCLVYAGFVSFSSFFASPFTRQVTAEFILSLLVLLLLVLLSCSSVLCPGSACFSSLSCGSYSFGILRLVLVLVLLRALFSFVCVGGTSRVSSSFSYYSSLHSSSSDSRGHGPLFYSLNLPGCPSLSFLFSDFDLCLNSFAHLKFPGFLILLRQVW